MLQEAAHIKNTVVLIFRHIQCLHLINSEVAWVLVSSGTQVQPQIILDQDYLPDYLSVSYHYVYIKSYTSLGNFITVMIIMIIIIMIMIITTIILIY